MASSIEDMAYALDTTHDPDKEDCEEARALLIRLVRGLDKFAEHVHPCPEGQDCNCGLGPLLADGLRVLAAFGAERLPR